MPRVSRHRKGGPGASVSRLTAGWPPEAENYLGSQEPLHRSQGVHMRVAKLAILSLLTVAACQSRPGADETGRAGDAGMTADTTVTTNETLDTTVVTKDTDVDVDTTHKEGDTTIDKDTLKQ